MLKITTVSYRNLNNNITNDIYTNCKFTNIGYKFTTKIERVRKNLFLLIKMFVNFIII